MNHPDSMAAPLPAPPVVRPAAIARPIAASAVFIGLMALTGQALQHGFLPSWQVTSSKVVNFTVTMQLTVLPLSLLAVGFARWCYPAGFRTFFRFRLSPGKSEAPNDWAQLGPLVALSFALGLALLLAPGVLAEKGRLNAAFLQLLPLVLLLAAMNAWSEEIFARLILIAGLHGKLEAGTICWISAALFGLPHFLGTPSGIFGVISSGFLGWLLARSVLETRSLGWALLIHFVQDVVIFGAGAMILAGNA